MGLSHPKDAKPKMVGSIIRRVANWLGVLQQKGGKQGLHTLFWAVTSECFRQLRSQSVSLGSPVVMLYLVLKTYTAAPVYRRGMMGFCI